MRPRARRTIDMLPLLDVFMVVLFVFATIQEHELEADTHELAALREQAEAAQTRATQQLGQAQRELAQYRQLCGDAKPGGPLCPAIELDPQTTAERLEIDTLLARLFDNVAVFEIELEGEPDLERGLLLNHCCYRADPPEGAWTSCGIVPSAGADRARWIRDGGQGLLDGLRRTRGGNAIVLIRQGSHARYRLTNELADALREQLPGHRIYDDGELVPLDCPLLPR